MTILLFFLIFEKILIPMISTEQLKDLQEREQVLRRSL